jgi:hypothetical protein
MGNEPTVCCQPDCEGKKACSRGRKTAGLTFAPLRRSVARAERGFRAVAVVVDEVGARVCEVVWACGAGTRDSLSCGNAPLARKRRGSVVERPKGAGGAGSEALAVADDAVVEECEGSRPPNVPDESVFGDAACERAPPIFARIARSPPVGPVPLYGSAKTV